MARFTANSIAVAAPLEQQCVRSGRWISRCNSTAAKCRNECCFSSSSSSSWNISAVSTTVGCTNRRAWNWGANEWPITISHGCINCNNAAWTCSNRSIRSPWYNISAIVPEQFQSCATTTSLQWLLLQLGGITTTSRCTCRWVSTDAVFATWSKNTISQRVMRATFGGSPISVVTTRSQSMAKIRRVLGGESSKSSYSQKKSRAGGSGGIFKCWSIINPEWPAWPTKGKRCCCNTAWLVMSLSSSISAAVSSAVLLPVMA